jgi:hypothetical protein
MPGPNFNEPIEESFSEWFNPLDREQYVDIREGDSPRPTRYRIPSKGSKTIPSRYDSVVQCVHNGVIIGGQAPQLVKRGSDVILDDALNTELSKKKQAEAELVIASMKKAAAEDATVLATANAVEAERKMRSQETSSKHDERPLPPDAKKPRG